MLDNVISPIRGGFETKMASNHYIFVVFFVLFVGYAFSSSTDQKLATLEQNFQSLVHNVSDLRKDMVAADALKLYLTQEISFRSELERQIKELADNYTSLQDLYTEQQLHQLELTNNYTSLQDLYIEQQLRFQDLTHNHTALNDLYIQSKVEQQHQETEIRALRYNFTVLQQVQNHMQNEMQEFQTNHTILQTQYTKEKEDINNSLKSLINNETLFHAEIKDTSLEFRQNISDLTSEFRRNFSVINFLYKDDLQQTYDIKQKQSILEQEVRQISISLLDVEAKQQNCNDSKEIIASVQRELAKQKDDNDDLRNSTEHIKQLIATVNKDLLFNISSLQTSLNQFSTKGKFLLKSWAYVNEYFRAETIHCGFDFVRFILLGSEFDSFSLFSVRSVCIFSHTYARS